MFETECATCGKKIKRRNYLAKKFKNFFCCKKCAGLFKRKENDIILEKDFARIIINTLNHGTIESLISLEDVDKIKNIKWHASFDKTVNNFYIKSKYVQLHRFVTECPKNKVVDHINHDTTDNRRCNLRICTQTENNQNRNGCYSTNNYSKIRNVSWHKQRQKWQVSLGIKGKQKYIGIFDSLIDAEQAAIAARKKYYTHSIENLRED